MTRIFRTLTSGARAVTVDAEPGSVLLDVLRSELGVRSAARWCQDGTCGACRVILGGALVPSCRVAWKDVPEGATVETYEQLASDPAAMRAVDAFAEERPTRCKMCVGALGVTAVAMARARVARHPPDETKGAAGEGGGGPEGDGGDDAAREEALEAALRDATCMCTGRGSWRRALSK